MKCPYCHTENTDGARFCMQCGKPVGRGAVRQAVLVALGKALLYVMLFFGMQETVTFFYSATLSFRMIQAGFSDPTEILTAVLESYAQDIHLFIILSGLLTVLALCIFFRLRRKQPLVEISLRPICPKNAVMAFLAGVALQFAVTGTVALIPIPAGMIESFSENTAALTNGALWLQIVSTAVVTPIVEETVFRGLVFTRLSRAMRPWVAVVLSGAIFGIVHGHPISFVYAGVLGIIFAWLMRRQNGSIAAPILCHAGFNGATFLVSLFGEVTLPFLAVYFVSLAAVICLLYFLLRTPQEKSERISDI